MCKSKAVELQQAFTSIFINELLKTMFPGYGNIEEMSSGLLNKSYSSFVETLAGSEDVFGLTRFVTIN